MNKTRQARKNAEALTTVLRQYRRNHEELSKKYSTMKTNYNILSKQFSLSEQLNEENKIVFADNLSKMKAMSEALKTQNENERKESREKIATLEQENMTLEEKIVEYEAGKLQQASEVEELRRKYEEAEQMNEKAKERFKENTQSMLELTLQAKAQNETERKKSQEKYEMLMHENMELQEKLQKYEQGKISEEKALEEMKQEFNIVQARYENLKETFEFWQEEYALDSKLRKQFEENKEQLVTMTKEKEETVKMIQELSSMNSEMEREFREMTEAMKKERLKNEEMEKVVASITNRNDETKTSLEKEIKTLTIEVQLLEDITVKRNREVYELNVLLSEKENLLNEKEQDIKESHQKLVNEMKEIESKLEEQKKETELFKKSHFRQRDEIKNLTFKLAVEPNAKGKLQEREQELQQLRKKYNMVKKQFSEFRQANISAQEEKMTFEFQLQQMAKQVADLEAISGKQTEVIEDYSGLVYDLNEDISTYKREIRNLNDRAEALDSELTALKEELKTTEEIRNANDEARLQKVQELRENLNSVRYELEEIENEKSFYEAQIDQVSGDKELLSKQLTRMKEENEVLQKQSEKVATLLQQSNEKVAHMKQQLKNADNLMKTMTSKKDMEIAQLEQLQEEEKQYHAVIMETMELQLKAYTEYSETQALIYKKRENDMDSSFMRREILSLKKELAKKDQHIMRMLKLEKENVDLRSRIFGEIDKGFPVSVRRNIDVTTALNAFDEIRRLKQRSEESKAEISNEFERQLNEEKSITQNLSRRLDAMSIKKLSKDSDAKIRDLQNSVAKVRSTFVEVSSHTPKQLRLARIRDSMAMEPEVLDFSEMGGDDDDLEMKQSMSESLESLKPSRKKEADVLRESTLQSIIQEMTNQINNDRSLTTNQRLKQLSTVKAKAERRHQRQLAEEKKAQQASVLTRAQSKSTIRVTRSMIPVKKNKSVM